MKIHVDVTDLLIAVDVNILEEPVFPARVFASVMATVTFKDEVFVSRR